MKTILLLILIVLCQFLIGFGFLRKFKFLPGTLQTLSLSMLFGLALSTVILFVMEILFIPISLLFYIILNFAVIIALHFRLKESLADLKALWTVRTIRPKIYHLVILGAVLYLAFISIWRCYYTPITPRDTVIGMDLVAKYAVEEQRIASSVFSQDFLRGKLSNQPFYAPFTAFMQIIYRMSGLAFGKIWLSIVFVCLLLFLYARLRETLHPLLAGLFLLLLMAIPEFYAYTFMVLTDFSNAVFFGISAIFFYDYMKTQSTKMLILSAISMGFACWCRSETLVFAVLSSLLLFVLESKKDLKKALIRSAVFIAIPLVFFLMWNVFYIGVYLESAPHNQLNPELLSAAGFFQVIKQINRILVFNTDLYGYAIVFFIGCTVLNLILFRDFNGFEMLAWILLLYIGFAIIAHAFPAASIHNTIKRSFFKCFPILFFYLGQIKLFTSLSGRLERWENA